MKKILLRLYAFTATQWRLLQPHRGKFLILVVLAIAGIIWMVGYGADTRAAAQLEQSTNYPGDDQDIPSEFQFIGQGRVTAGSDGVWVIGGVPIQVGAHTQLMARIHVGDFVSLSGRILGNETWLADRIELAQENGSFFTFNGPLDWARGIVWRIGGHSLLANLQTKLGSNLSANEILLVTFTVLENGAWQALEIKAFDPALFEPMPTSTDMEPRQKVEPTATTIPAPAESKFEDGAEGKDKDKDHKDGKKKDKDKDQDKRDKDNKSKGTHDNNNGDEHDDDGGDRDRDDDGDYEDVD